MATEHDLAQPRAWSMGVAGWCVAENGDLDRGLALLTRKRSPPCRRFNRAISCLSAWLAGGCAPQGRAPRRGDESRGGRDRTGRGHRRALLQRGTPSATRRAVGSSAARPEAQGRKRRSAPPSRLPSSKGAGLWSTRQVKAYAAGPDTNGLIVAICLAFNSEEARFFRSAHVAYMAHRVISRQRSNRSLSGV